MHNGRWKSVRVMHRLDWLDSLRYKSFSDGAFFLSNYPWVRRETKHLLRDIDLDAFRQIGRKQTRRTFNSLYLTLRDVLAISLYRLRRLRLDVGPPRAILDIGTGPGVFPYVCQRFGHQVVCTDVDTTDYYNEVTQFFNLDRRIWRVERGVPAPDFSETFDIVTATNVGFNVIRDIAAGFRGQREWFVDDWAFFLYDLATHLVRPNGKIYLTINQIQRRKRNKQQDRVLLDYFAACSAILPSHGHILFEDMKRLSKALYPKIGARCS